MLLQTDIRGLVNNMENINKYTPLFEAITNSIQSINDLGREDGEIVITAIRPQMSYDKGTLADVEGFSVKDNGVGFNNRNFESFKVAYTRNKVDIGGKGFGRFSFLKVFSKADVKSVFYDEKDATGEAKSSKCFKQIDFEFSLSANGISAPREKSLTTKPETETTLTLSELKPGKNFDKQLSTIARKIVEHFLIMFSQQAEKLPTITLRDEEESIKLNDYICNSNDIQLIDESELELKSESEVSKFGLKIFKLFYSSDQTNSINLCAHDREVTSIATATYVPDFKRKFIDEKRGKDEKVSEEYTIKAYVFGEYLDNSVCTDRNKFNFPKSEADPFYAFSKAQIEGAVGDFLAEKFEHLITKRSKNKKSRIEKFIEQEAPWYKPIFNSLDISKIDEDISDNELSIELYKLQTNKELEARKKTQELLSPNNSKLIKSDDLKELVSNVSEVGKSELIHYVANRKLIIELLERSLQINNEGKYESEDFMHDIIFPRKKDSDSVNYDDSNLWLIDEKLNFSLFVASDKAISPTEGKRPDLLVYDKPIAMREGNEASNPVTIFEFKKPQKGKYKKLLEKEALTDDPIKQIYTYAQKIREGNAYAPGGRDLKIDKENTPFYGFVICDLTKKLKDLCRNDYSLTPSPDGEGFYGFHPGFRIYYEVISFDKLLNDAKLRNRVFFHKLGLTSNSAFFDN